MTVYSGPEYYKGPKLQRSIVRAKDGQTWQAGQPCRRSDSGLVLCVSSATSFQGLTAATQPAATSSSDVYVDFIPSEQTQLKIYCTNASDDTRALTSYIGSNQGLAINDCVGTLSTGNDSNEILNVKDLMSNVEGYKNDTSTLPGAVLVTVVASALTTEGTGQ